MEKLLDFIGSQLRCGLKETVDSRISEFRELGSKPAKEIFKELCFCLLTANYSAEGGIRIQREIGDGFLTLPEGELAAELRRLGHRYPEARAGYIVAAREHIEGLMEVLGSGRDQKDVREWVVGNVKGLGYKEASHFLRNIGFDGLAIIDFHIVDLLVRYGLIERPKTLTKRRYLEIEKVLEEVAGRSGITLAELDLYLWCAETGKVLK
jgi:N-glycosylase/DNA lyase